MKNFQHIKLLEMDRIISLFRSSSRIVEPFPFTLAFRCVSRFEGEGLAKTRMAIYKEIRDIDRVNWDRIYRFILI